MSLAPLARTTTLFYGSLLACIAIYQLGLPGGFLLDDPAHLPLHLEDLSLRTMIDATLSSGIGEAGRYFSFLTFAFTEVTHGASPSGYLRHNILLHALTACVQFWALGRILGAERFQSAIVHPWFIAAVATALWLLHPLLVSTVLYSVQRMTILAAFFTWLTLLFYTVGRQAIVERRPVLATSVLLVGVPAATFLGCLSKETTALVPVYLALVEWFAFPGTPADRNRRIAIWSTRIVLIALPLSLGAIVLLIAHDRFLEGYATRTFSLGERLMTEGYAIWWYVKVTLLPLVRDLSLYQDAFPIVSPSNLAAWIAGLSLPILFVLSLIPSRRMVVTGFCVSMFLASHLLESTILPLEPVFEHRNYFGAVFLLMLACHVVMTLHARIDWSEPVLRHLPVALLTLSLAALAAQTSMRAWAWSTKPMHTLTSVRDRPDSLRARVELANLYLNNGQISEARTVLRKASEFSSDEPGLQVHLLMISCISDTTDTKHTDAVSALRNGRITAYTVTVFDRLSNFIRTGRCANVSPDQFRELVEAALESNAILVRWRYFLNVLAARTLAPAGEIEMALEFAQRAVSLADSAPIAHRHRAYIDHAQLSLMLGDRNQAQETLAILEALATDPRTSFDKELREVQEVFRDARSPVEPRPSIQNGNPNDDD